jgi:hypothetical protein
MNTQAKDELKGILAAYGARIVGSQQREAKLKADRASFVELFRGLKTDMIAPILNDFAVQLNEHGHLATVLDQEEPSHRNGSFVPASIALRIVPLAMSRPDSISQASNGPVEVKFSANQNEMKVLVSSSHNAQGGSGKRGEYPLADLTEEFVVRSVLRTIHEAFTEGH